MSEYILGIEAAISGGSLALLDGDTVLASWRSPTTDSRSEQLLPKIAEMIADAGLRPNQLDRIGVSNGPGSFTGIRIGIATAMGLSAALEKPCIGISALASIGRNCGVEDGVIVVVPIGRDGFSWGEFDANGRQESEAGTSSSGRKETLLDYLVNKPPTYPVVCHSDAFEVVAEMFTGRESSPRLIGFGRDLAIPIGRDSRHLNEGLQPVYPLSAPREGVNSAQETR